MTRSKRRSQAIASAVQADVHIEGGEGDDFFYAEFVNRLEHVDPDGFEGESID